MEHAQYKYQNIIIIYSGKKYDFRHQFFIKLLNAVNQKRINATFFSTLTFDDYEVISRNAKTWCRMISCKEGNCKIEDVDF